MPRGQRGQGLILGRDLDGALEGRGCWGEGLCFTSLPTRLWPPGIPSQQPGRTPIRIFEDQMGSGLDPGHGRAGSPHPEEQLTWAPGRGLGPREASGSLYPFHSWGQGSGGPQFIQNHSVCKRWRWDWNPGHPGPEHIPFALLGTRPGVTAGLSTHGGPQRGEGGS